MVKKILVIVVLLPLLVLIFAPKNELLYLLEKRLAAQGIILSDGVVDEHPFGLTIDHPSIYYKGIKVATAKQISFWSVLLYTRGTIDGIVFDHSLKSYLPSKLKQLTLMHSVAQPVRISLWLHDAMLPGEGEVNLRAHRITMRFAKLPKETPLARYMKQTKGGWVYAQRF